MTSTVEEPVQAGEGESRVVIRVRWALYRQIIRELGDNRATRIAYDDGRLEIKSPSYLHENVKRTAGRLIEAYADGTGVDVEAYGSWTLESEKSQKAIEPDGCYYVQNLAAIAGRRRRDLSVDPPPDLVIEVDITRSTLPKQPIYAALGVPEVWRYDGQQFVIMLRADAGGYAESRQSRSFPDLPIGEFNRFLRIGLESHQPAAVRALREWLKGQSAGR